MARGNSFATLAAAGIRGLQPYIPGKPLDELEREYGISDAVKLASNENPLGPSARAMAAISDASAELNRYPDGSGHHLKQALAAHLGVASGQLTLGNGSNDVLVLLAETFLTPATAAIYSEYSFVVYRLVVQATGARAAIAAANSHGHDQALGHDLDGMLELVDADTRVVFIANPNNPTGTWVEGSALRAFVEQVPGEVIVVVDEAYHEYAKSDAYPDTVRWIGEFPNLVVTRTFSKVYGLAGLRVGYAISDPEIAELLNRVRQPFNVNSLALAAAEAALADQAYVEQGCALNQQGLDVLRRGLGELGCAVSPSAANFVLVDVGAPAEACYQSLLRNGVIVRPVANYGLPNHLRISVGLPEENRRLLAAMAAYLEGQG